jgi:hypothetical protein
MMTRCCWHDDDMMKRLPLDTWNANRALATVSCARCQLHLLKVLDISSGVLYLNITTSHRDVTGMVLRIGGTILHPHMSELSMVGELSINSEVSFESFWGADEWPGAVLSSCYHHVKSSCQQFFREQNQQSRDVEWPFVCPSIKISPVHPRICWLNPIMGDP